MNMHGVSLEEEDPRISGEGGSKEEKYLDVHIIGNEENPVSKVADSEGRTTVDEDDSMRSDSGQEVGVTTSEDNPDSVKS